MKHHRHTLLVPLGLVAYHVALFLAVLLLSRQTAISAVHDMNLPRDVGETELNSQEVPAIGIIPEMSKMRRSILMSELALAGNATAIANIEAQIASVQTTVATLQTSVATVQTAVSYMQTSIGLLQAAVAKQTDDQHMVQSNPGDVASALRTLNQSVEQNHNTLLLINRTLAQDHGAIVSLTSHERDPGTVFNVLEQCYFHGDPCAAFMWQSGSNTMFGVAGNSWTSCPSDDYHGLLTWTAGTGGYPSSGGKTVVTDFPICGMVYIPKTSRLVYTTTHGMDWPARANSLHIAKMPVDAVSITSHCPIVWSDGFDGYCALLSNSDSEFLCLSHNGVVRVYEAHETGCTLYLRHTVQLQQFALGSQLSSDFHGSPSAGDNTADAYVGLFAWDGMHFFVPNYPHDTGAAGTLAYKVWAADGSFVGLFHAEGDGYMTAVYFDWSVHRYSVYDAEGRHGHNTNHRYGTGSDSQCYGPVVTVFN